eukprot:CAMPEP_0183462194 /NCGR_PEP_ID=MMETSP0370-20130417/141214_1 /TAXON_ID=268820 /ORGANISM="Peridinium aciculiferum, Strain PAER-2" /LENGTH=103 /DNA_ID=CAMNT_0025654197 /DNA_START=24 /DNA_END=331 /DNA_ORIENTATION=+
MWPSEAGDIASWALGKLALCVRRMLSAGAVGAATLNGIEWWALGVLVTELVALGEVKLAASVLPEAQDVEASERLRLLLVRLREPPVILKSTDLVPAPAVAPA